MKISLTEQNRLRQLAKEASDLAYAKYSHFHVGAALYCGDSEIIQGSNVENRSFGLTVCAERSAFCSAVSQGKREFLALALYCADATSLTPPCGACRQFISEFVGPDFPIFIDFPGGNKILTIADLLPHDSLHELAAE